VMYSGRGFGYESVYVDGEIAVRYFNLYWFIPRLEFTIKSMQASIEVRVWPWLALRSIRLVIEDELSYSEGIEEI
jgi:hypothetical protein